MSSHREGSEVVDHRLAAAVVGQWQVAWGSESRPNVMFMSRLTLIGREFVSYYVMADSDYLFQDKI